MSKILITGGQGYIARNLAPLLEHIGYEVLAPSRTELDILDHKGLHDYCEREHPRVVVHAAAMGGKRLKTDTFEDTYLPNIKMFENISNVQALNCGVPLILLGSGAEFDRREEIKKDEEDTIFQRWPIDPYGLSKNLIARRALKELNGVFVLRLFGCFNYDDDPSRFIKNAVLNLKRGLPITVHQDRMIDYFYLDDIATVIDYILDHPTTTPKNLNLVYRDKVSLLDIASLVHKHTQIFKPTINLVETGIGPEYTGNSYFLNRMQQLDPSFKLLGLEEGIRRTVLKLT